MTDAALPVGRGLPAVLKGAVEAKLKVRHAQERRFVLYGRTGEPACMADPEHGTISGAALIFTNRGDSVEVDGGNARAVTDTQVPK